jgi:hypothetical protein
MAGLSKSYRYWTIIDSRYLQPIFGASVDIDPALSDQISHVWDEEIDIRDQDGNNANLYSV